MNGHKTEARSIYIAGPMTGVEDYNYPMFDVVAEMLREWGFEVVNPTELKHNEDPEADVSLDEYMVLDLPYVIACDALALLPGWEQSRGSNVELLVALACGREVWEIFEDDRDDSAIFVLSDARPNLWVVQRHIEDIVQTVEL